LRRREEEKERGREEEVINAQTHILHSSKVKRRRKLIIMEIREREGEKISKLVRLDSW
jgi:hypothetical protein